MFIEVRTEERGKLLVNTDHIIEIAADEDGLCKIWTIEGNVWLYTEESYSEMKEKLLS
jgi:hypothetical protein